MIRITGFFQSGIGASYSIGFSLVVVGVLSLLPPIKPKLTKGGFGALAGSEVILRRLRCKYISEIFANCSSQRWCGKLMADILANTNKSLCLPCWAFAGERPMTFK